MNPRNGLVVMAVVAAMLVLSIVFPAMGNPAAILLIASVTLGLTMVKDRRTAVRLAVAGSVVFALVAWAAAQPGYVF